MEKMEKRNFHERLRTLREERGLTQQQVADAIGMDRASYTYYESGKVGPSIANLKRLSEALDVSVTELLGCEDE